MLQFRENGDIHKKQSLSVTVEKKLLSLLKKKLLEIAKCICYNVPS